MFTNRLTSKQACSSKLNMNNQFLKFILSFFFLQAHLCAAPSTDRIEQAMLTAIESKEIPGGVVLINHQGKTIYHKAFGNLMVTPKKIPAIPEGLYDLTSITKIYTATLIMILHDQGKLDVTKPVADYLPSFNTADKKTITIEQLLTHRSGLPVIIPTPLFEEGLPTAVKNISQAKLVAKPGSSYLYSDLGPITASYIAEQVTGKPFEQLLQEYILQPLGLNNTAFTPAKTHPLDTIAPNNTDSGELRHGYCWSPRSHALGGVGGSSGLFASASDLLCFAQLFLHDGIAQNGQRILSQNSIKLMTTPHKNTPAGEKRGIGFDFETDSAFARGKKFGPESFGHTGTSGTTLWIDPITQTIIIILSNRFHPETRSKFKYPRITIATLAALMVEKRSKEALAF